MRSTLQVDPCIVISTPLYHNQTALTELSGPSAKQGWQDVIISGLTFIAGSFNSRQAQATHVPAKVVYYYQRACFLLNNGHAPRAFHFHTNVYLLLGVLGNCESAIKKSKRPSSFISSSLAFRASRPHPHSFSPSHLRSVIVAHDDHQHHPTFPGKTAILCRCS